MDSEIKVSVCVVTYNQEKYIAECLQSLVNQKTDFKFEVIIGEDCSTDRTRDIVEGFALKYPNIIVRNYHDENVGAVKNVISTYKMAKGKYIAHVDGDDYALPGKLQAQFDILEANPECVICSHDVVVVNNKSQLINKSFTKHEKKINNLMDLYEHLPFFAHSSKMFLNDLDNSFWNDLHPEALDIEVHIQQAKKGNIFHINEVLGVYRSDVGVSRSDECVNPLFTNSKKRIFEEAIQDNKNNTSKLKKIYARTLLDYSYASALLNDKIGVQSFARASVKVKIISTLQIIMYLFSFFPNTFIRICHYRKTKTN